MSAENFSTATETDPLPLPTSSLRTLAVIGAGTMGRGIAETAAVHGLQVIVIEANPAALQTAQQQVATALDKAQRRDKLRGQTPADITARMQWSTQVDDAACADFVVEAVSEQEHIKRELFTRLDTLCRPDVILASNTSSISITRLAVLTQRPTQVIGMHFFNPVPIMAPVEIVRGLTTADSTVAVTRDLAERLGKQALVVADSPGFVVNRILMPLLNEAFFTLHEGVADAATIDSLMQLGCNHPIGPLKLADLIGLDVCLSILRVLHHEFGDPKFRPCPLLIRMVDAGHLGRKTNRGFYVYP